MNPLSIDLPEGRLWLRVASPEWSQPLDASYAREAGGRWNAPGSYPTLYLNANVVTARLQIERMCAGTPVTVDDLADDAYVLIAATLPTAHRAADACSAEGLTALGLPQSYPLDAHGELVAHQICQPIGAQARAKDFDGVWCRSACSNDGRGRELAWFPQGTQQARPVWDVPLTFGHWRYAERWSDLNVGEQTDPA